MKNIDRFEMFIITLLVSILMTGCSKQENPVESSKTEPPLIVMVSIPAGTFTMGCTSEQSGCGFDENPTHQVTLSAFEIGKFEVTQKEWKSIMGDSPSFFVGENRPVEQVSWEDVILFCNNLSIREGLTPLYTINGTSVTVNWDAEGYRLPTEAEWEYAARGGAATTNTLYSGSNQINDVAWNIKNSGNSTHDVGTKNPNQIGLYDMSGNVYEWCWDWHSIYNSSHQTNPRGIAGGNYRVFRGGNWNNSVETCRVSYRARYAPNVRYSALGFRIVRTKN